jgi:hypothetical protein
MGTDTIFPYRWAAGSGLDWIDKIMGRDQGKPTGKEPGPEMIPAAGGAPGVTDDEWRRMDEEGYQKYQRNLSVRKSSQNPRRPSRSPGPIR